MRSISRRIGLYSVILLLSAIFAAWIGIALNLDVIFSGFYSVILIEVFGIAITVLTIEEYIRYRSRAPVRELIKGTFVFAPTSMRDALLYTFKELFREDIEETDLKKLILNKRIVDFAEKKRREYLDYRAVQDLAKGFDIGEFNWIQRGLIAKYEVVLAHLRPITGYLIHYPGKLHARIQSLEKMINAFVSNWRDKTVLGEERINLVYGAFNIVHMTAWILHDYIEETDGEIDSL